MTQPRWGVVWRGSTDVELVVFSIGGGGDEGDADVVAVRIERRPVAHHEPEPAVEVQHGLEVSYVDGGMGHLHGHRRIIA